MERQIFMHGCLAVGAFLISPIQLIAKSISKYRDGSGFMIGAGKDRFNKPMSLLQGDTFFTKISSQDTNGDLYVYQSTRLKEGGPLIFTRTNGGLSIVNGTGSLTNFLLHCDSGVWLFAFKLAKIF